MIKLRFGVTWYFLITNIIYLKYEQETEFCNLAEETQEMLDIVADSIFLEWYDYMYMRINTKM